MHATIANKHLIHVRNLAVVAHHVKVIRETGLTSSDVSGTQRGELCAVATAIVDSEVGVEAVRARSDTGVVPRSDGGPGSIVGTYSGANMGASKPMKCGPG